MRQNLPTPPHGRWQSPWWKASKVKTNDQWRKCFLTSTRPPSKHGRQSCSLGVPISFHQRPSSAKDTLSGNCRWREGSIHLADGPPLGWLQVFTLKEWIQGRHPSPVLLDTASLAIIMCMWPSFHGRTCSLMLTWRLSRSPSQWGERSARQSSGWNMRERQPRAHFEAPGRWAVGANSELKRECQSRHQGRRLLGGEQAWMHIFWRQGVLPHARSHRHRSLPQIYRSQEQKSADSTKSVSWMWNEEHSHPGILGNGCCWPGCHSIF